MKKTALLTAAATALLFAGGAADAKNCNKGKPCGNSCISRDKVCRIGTPSPAPVVTPSTPSYIPAAQPTYTLPQPPQPTRSPVAMKGVTYFAAGEFREVGTISKQGEAYTLGYGTTRLTVTPDTAEATLNEAATTLNAAPFVWEGKLYLPVRALDTMGCTRAPETTFLMATCGGNIFTSIDTLLY